jgi:hypothetical protein
LQNGSCPSHPFDPLSYRQTHFFGVLQVGVATDDLHELVNVGNGHLGAFELLHQGIKLAVLLEDKDGCVDAYAVRGVPQLGPTSEPTSSQLALLLDALPQVLDGGGVCGRAFNFFDEGAPHRLPRVDVVLGEVVIHMWVDPSSIRGR